MSEPLTPNDSAVESSTAIELDGALPPSDTEEITETRDEPPIEELPLQGFKRWGPWKRWKFYREFRHRDSDVERDRDAEDNASGRLPDEEGVQLPGIWVIELYTPSTVGGLLKGIRDLGWEYGRSRTDSLTKWMNDVRDGRQAGWVSLGLVSPLNAAHFMRERSAKLPHGVTAAIPVLMCLTPSITAFIIVFLFDAESANSLEVSLRENFTTTTHSTSCRAWDLIRYIVADYDSVRFSQSIQNSDYLRREALKSKLKAIERGCVQWVQKHFPGAFDSLPQSRLPTAILLVTEKVKPLSDNAFKIRAFEGLAIGRNYDAWESSEWPGARLVMPRSWDDEGNRLTFACRRQDAFPNSHEYHEPTSNWTIAQRADDFIQGLVSRWAITCLLDSYHETLSVMRDEIARDDSYRTISDLKKLRSFARTLLYDIGTCTHEIEEFSRSKSGYRHNVIEMTYIRSLHGERHEFLKSLSFSQGKRARQVRRESELFQATLSTSNDLSQTISNIRIQRLIVFLTVISIAIALWSVFHTQSTTSEHCCSMLIARSFPPLESAKRIIGRLLLEFQFLVI